MVVWQPPAQTDPSMASPDQLKLSPQDHGEASSHKERHRRWGISEVSGKRMSGNNRYLQQHNFVLDVKSPFFHSAHTQKLGSEQVAQRESTISSLSNFQNLAEQRPKLPLNLSLLWAWGGTRWLSKICSNLGFLWRFSREASRGQTRSFAQSLSGCRLRLAQRVFIRRFGRSPQSTQYGHQLPAAPTEDVVSKGTNLSTNLK